LGTTLDFSSNEISDSLGIKFDNTKASDWLKENAYNYGFVLSFPQGYENTTGFSYEPWHYRYIGRADALLMKNSGMILEEYLRSKN
jgi:D-alanyl-D-alanine carboxypeptidase